ncbi:hypothetical protein [Candidatus Leptofilum sp.]|uniref:hypothetical protein n=1 Tax=Candidatus Leptofilum sp. TaxID=3241576 RepID=UPI003B5BB5F6
MAGQPYVEGFAEFDVNDIKVTWEQGTAGGNNLAILDLNEAFNITVTFAGKGTQWQNMQNLGLQYNVAIFAEGIGLPPVDQNLGVTAGNLVPGQQVPYEVVCNIGGINQSGVYRLAAMVTFPTWTGWLGFLEGPFIQVHDQEQ